MDQSRMELLERRVDALEKAISSKADDHPNSKLLSLVGMFRDSEFHLSVVSEGNAIREAERAAARRGEFPE